MMVIDNKYEIGEDVYLKTDLDQQLRIVTAIHVHPSGQIIYVLAYGTMASEHYDFEISREVNELIKMK
jgi:hypothetical protein